MDYRLHCDQLVNDLNEKAVQGNEEKEEEVSAFTPKPASQRRDTETSPKVLGDDLSGAIQIGKYANAVHFRDGLYSDVYKAPNIAKTGDSPKFVALKVTYPSAMQPPHNSEREIRILRAAASEHVVALLDSFRDSVGDIGGTRLVLVFPFFRYDFDRVLRQRLLPEAKAKRHLKDLFSALAWIHGLGMIHRDVKPSNILLPSLDGPAYLADFGVAWCENDPASERRDHKIIDVGTSHYRPPELLFGNFNYSEAVDLWAAGCVLAEVACLAAGMQSLFDCTEGSELQLISSIFQSLGTPTADTWPVGCLNLWLFNSADR